ncbi:MAG: transcription-repair coupling factor, partial [Proteobacteria bacterium]|nr:transcription-repair coupling factor [Pseudomonadota bacterium]
MNREKERINRLHTFDLIDCLASVASSSPIAVRGLHPASIAPFVAELMSVQRTPMLILAQNDDTLAKCCEDMAFFARSLKDDTCLVPPLSDSLYSGAAQNRRHLALRLRALNQLASSQPLITLCTFQTLARRCMPKDKLLSATMTVRRGQDLPSAWLRHRLQTWGYTEESEVDLPGTFAVRGSIIDIFSPAHDAPIRIERFDDEVESMRTFDPDTQKTQHAIETATIIPASEILMDDEGIAKALQSVGEIADTHAFPSKCLRQCCEKIQEKIPFWGIQALMPAYHEHTDLLFDYLPPKAIVLWIEPDACLESFRQHQNQLTRQYTHAIAETNFVSPPQAHFLSDETCQSLLEERKLLISGMALQLKAKTSQTIAYDTLDNQDIVARRNQLASGHAENYLSLLADCFEQWQGIYGEIALVASTPGAADRLKALLRPLDLSLRVDTGPFQLHAQRHTPCHDITLCIGTLNAGIRLPHLKLAILTEAEILGTQIRRAKKQTQESHTILTSFRDLKPGDYVVHEDHGIGQYQGLVTLEVSGIKGDFLHIIYAEKGKLYIPIQRLKSVQKYAGAEKPHKLDKLGGGAWERTKEKVRQSVRQLAINLLDLYAKRQQQPGFAFSPPDPYFQTFEAGFDYTETPDQDKAIQAVLEDMQKPRPMERLICGDVGFGKTEVAMRAAMRAVLDTKQVAILVPTTLLAEQHLKTFTTRFDGYPVRIEALNRFRKPKEVKQILSDLAIGKIDILIGTHRILSKDVVFKDLGLLVVDEEHRFGVGHKEKIKAMSESVDCLTMTATPIPRTFQMCLGGFKDLSVIETPPLDRLSIHTFVAVSSDALIAEAIERELNRGGQVYFLHNRVEELPNYYERLKRLVPRARIGIAHGQMDEKTLESTMFEFIHRRLDILLCTTIIESGIDIPSANCLIVNHAERFGLAQLYQIRGRVGRSSTRAYCYLLTGKTALTDVARERLSAIERLT